VRSTPALLPFIALTIILLSRPTRAQTTDPTPIDYSTRLTGDWSGYRRQLADKGIDLQLSFVADGTKNLTGGLDTAGTASRTLVDLRLTLDTQPLVGLAGGTVYLDFQTTQGKNASDHLTGDLQGIDNLDAVPGAADQNRTQLSQLWYQQSLWDDKLQLKFGKADVNADFDHLDSAQEFIHQSYGSSATLFTLPTYPDPAIGLSVFFEPQPDWRFAFGIHDGSLADDIPTGELGPAPYFHHTGDVFLMAEIDKSWSEKTLPGRAGVGGWYSTNSFTRLDGHQADGTGGPYALFEQTLWRSNPQSLTLFLMYGYGDPSILPYDHNLGAGLAFTGPIPARKDDVVGVGIQAIHFSDDYNATADYEIDYELFYRIQLTPWFYVKPDVQYIQNPGGQGTPDALAVTLRAQIDF